MTAFEILYFNREFINRLAVEGLKIEDCKYVDLYLEFERMRNNGDKVTYIVSFLSDKYSVSERKIYNVIKRFRKRCTFPAA
jgi:hypothetical protein